MSTRRPSSTLVPLARLRDHSADQVLHCLQYLRDLYWPTTLPPKLSLHVRSVHAPIHVDSVPDSGYASAEEDEPSDDETLSVCDSESEELELLRSDTFERAFVVKWLTGLISRSEMWAAEAWNKEDENELRMSVAEEASSVIAAFVCNEEEAAVTRVFNFPGGVHVELNDALLSSSDHTSVGLQSWASSILLADRICATPATFSLDAPKSVLELGAGTGMLSIAVAKLFQSTNPSIIATDYHPDVLSNLKANINTNFPFSCPILVYPLDWESPDYTVSPLNRKFDVILAADVIYHPQHAEWIKQCVETLLADDGVFWLIIPLRATGRHEGMAHTVDRVFTTEETEGRRLVIAEVEESGRKVGVGRADECGYKLFKICWI